MKRNAEYEPHIVQIIEDWILALKGGDDKARAALEAYRERYEATVSQMFDRLAEPENNRKGLSMSALGHPARRLWHMDNGTPKAPKSSRSYMTFRAGDLVELEVVLFAKAALRWADSGGELRHTCLDAGGQAAVRLPKGEDTGEYIYGHPDGIYTPPPDLGLPERVLFEVKSKSDYGYKKAVRDGALDNTFGSTLGQTNAYCKALDLPGTLRIVVNKNTRAMAEFWEPVDPAVVMAFELAVETVVASEDMPPQCSADEVPYSPAGIYGWQEDKKGERLGLPCSYCDFWRACFPDAYLSIEGGKPVYRRREAEERAS